MDCVTKVIKKNERGCRKEAAVAVIGLRQSLNTLARRISRVQFDCAFPRRFSQLSVKSNTIN